MDIANVEVVHNEAEHRFEAHVDGRVALLTYKRFPDRFVLVHTEVPAPLRGEGIAAKLVETALHFARDLHLRIIPVCPYVTEFIRKHPEYGDLLSQEDRRKVLPTEPDPRNPDIQHADALRAMAFYEIARKAKLTAHPDLTKSTAFQSAEELYRARAEYLREAFGKQEAIDDYFRLHLEGALTKQGKTWQDVWAEFAPDSLKKFPLPPGTL